MSPVVERPREGDRCEISLMRHGGADVVSVAGEFDGCSERLVRRLVDDSRQVAQPQVVLDLSRVSFMDARAVGALVYCRRVLAARSAVMVLVCPGGPARRLLTVVGLDRVWTIHSTREQALRAVVR